ncbi:hypothetical protein L7F22_036385 [Adiantum nelumboides]|nr:hypothetical protein [Adiantum nelumboides]MCO5582488.1 hypothetical protein [Adiantum nelumboides]
MDERTFEKVPVNWNALDALILDYADAEQLLLESDKSLGSFVLRSTISHIRGLIEKGSINEALELLKLQAPSVLQDQRLLFRLHKQKFIEVLRAGGRQAQDEAIQCSRTVLGPYALTAYPGQKNVVADALSWKPLVQAIFAIHHSTFEDMVDQYATDTDFADIFTRIRDGETVAGCSLRKGYLMRKTMLCVTQPLQEKVMTKCHCPPYMRHHGIATTMKGVERYFYWPRLKKDVEEFVRSCLVCQKVKFDRHKAQGLLQPLPIPTRPWESISMDFIFDLPRTQSGHDGIWTIIDRFSKQAHFIPVKKTVKPDHLARLFVAQIF